MGIYIHLKEWRCDILNDKEIVMQYIKDSRECEGWILKKNFMH